MVGKLLIGGMIVGVLAGLICFIFLKFAGEPSVDRAIAFEARMEEAEANAASHDMSITGKETPGQAKAPEQELVSRPVQRGIGLLTGVVVYGTAFGGLFALVFAVTYGRMGGLGPRSVAGLLALMGFVSVYLVPSIKYPANPPAVGMSETIGPRTALYFAMIAISLAGMIAASMLQRRLVRRFGTWDATLIAGVAYVAALAVVALLLPTVDEVPENFPAILLWQFRIASMAAQFLMWSVIGLAFGRAAEAILETGQSRVKGRDERLARVR